ncbi:hypothetical protein BX616_007932 [Lobosporangium transversale]|nr:hypothetical protein BX616_007932 [Lobosporangium transversale]
MVIHNNNNGNSNVPEVPLALVSNAYLDELTAGLRARPIPWELLSSPYTLLQLLYQYQSNSNPTLVDRD